MLLSIIFVGNMKDKILQALKTKYKNLGLSEKALDGIATMLAVTTTDEANIETSIDGVNDLLVSIQSDADKRVNDAVAKVKQVKAPEPPKADETKVEEPKNETPEWAKALMSEVAALKAEKTVDLRKQTLEQKLKDVNPTFSAKILKDFQRMQFESDEDFDSYLAETEADAITFAKESVGSFGRPTKATGEFKGEASQEEISSIVNEIM